MTTQNTETVYKPAIFPGIVKAQRYADNVSSPGIYRQTVKHLLTSSLMIVGEMGEESLAEDRVEGEKVTESVHESVPVTQQSPPQQSSPPKSHTKSKLTKEERKIIITGQLLNSSYLQLVSAYTCIMGTHGLGMVLRLC